MKSFMQIRRVSLFAMMMSLVSCLNNEGGDSDSKDLLNFSRADGTGLTVNTCGPSSPRAHVKPYASQVQGTAQQTDFVLRAVGAAPKEMTRLFFEVLKGTVIVKAKIDVKNDCHIENDLEKSFLAEGNGDMFKSCWSKSSGRGPVVIVEDAANDNGKNIFHAMVRTMALIYTNVVAEGVAENGEVDDAKKAKSLFKSLESFSDAYVAAVEKRGPDIRSQAAKEADKAKAEYLKKQADALDKVAAKMKELSAKDKATFSKMVYAEMIDSLYCSQATYDGIKTNESGFSELPGKFRAEGLLFYYRSKNAEGKLETVRDCPWFIVGKPACQDLFLNKR